MAEANLDTFSKVSELFKKAASHLPTLVSKLDERSLLKLYGLYKQATVGSCDTPQPGWFQMEAKRKWEAWKELGDMKHQTAMENYIHMISEIDPKWNGVSTPSEQKSPGWAAVSTMTNTDVILAESEKDIFDWVKEGNVSKVSEFAKQSTDKAPTINAYDSEGMGLLHWAADRGNLEIVRCLIADMKAYVELKDSEGQTALHYAAACGHTDVVKFLLENGADPDASDGDGMAPFDVASESNIVDLLHPKK